MFSFVNPEFSEFFGIGNRSENLNSFKRSRLSIFEKEIFIFKILSLTKGKSFSKIFQFFAKKPQRFLQNSTKNFSGQVSIIFSRSFVGKKS